MGNHHVGRAMVATATALAEHSGLEPLAILDIACEPYRGADAEFDDEIEPWCPFGQLLIRAFDPNGGYKTVTLDKPYRRESFVDDATEEAWYEKVYEPFRERYGFC